MTISLEEHVARAIAPYVSPEDREDTARAAIDAVREYEGATSKSDLELSLKLICGPEVGCGDGGTFIVRTPSQKELVSAFASIRESERAAWEAIAREGSFPFDIDVWLNATKKEMTVHVALAIADAIAARKGKGEGK